jgi:hypothetical protein
MYIFAIKKQIKTKKMIFVCALFACVLPISASIRYILVVLVRHKTMILLRKIDN